MSRIFLSHLSANNAEAIATRDWMVAHGWDDVILDLDPERGLKAGERWQEALKRAAERSRRRVPRQAPKTSRLKEIRLIAETSADPTGALAAGDPADDHSMKAIAEKPPRSRLLDGATLWWGTLVALSTALLGPLLIADVPPILDYPNHLARLVLLAAGPTDLVLGRIFTPHWAIIPDLAADLIGPSLLHVLPAHIVGRLLLGSALLLNLSGVLTLHRALFGRNSFWPLASGLVAYNSTFLLGFINWQIGSGLAMLFAAAWLTWREARPLATVLATAMASLVLFFCHLVGLAFFLLLIGSAEVYAMRNCMAVLVRAMSLIAISAGPVILWLLSDLHAVPFDAFWITPNEKLVQLTSPFANYLFPLDVASAVLLCGGVVFGLAAGWLTLAPQAALATAVLVILYIVLPFNFMGTSFVDTRAAVMLGFLIFAVVTPVCLPQLPSRAIATALATLFTVRMLVVAAVWVEHRSDLASLRASISLVPAGASVYFTNVPPEEAPEYWDAGPRSRRLSNMLRTEYHLPALLLIERQAFWPVLFANPAQQPIRLRPAYAALAREAHDIPSHRALRIDPDSGSAALRDFDFVLMLEAGADQNLSAFVPRCLALQSRNDFAALFRVRHDVC